MPLAVPLGCNCAVRAAAFWHGFDNADGRLIKLCVQPYIYIMPWKTRGRRSAAAAAAVWYGVN